MNKVLMLYDNPLDFDARVEREAELLVSEGFVVEILAVLKEGYQAEELRNGYKISRTLDFIIKRPYDKNYTEYLERTTSEISNIDFDILICHDYYLANFGSIIKRKKPGCVFIYDSHEFVSGWPFYKESSGLINKLKGYFVWKRIIENERSGMQKADYCITVSDSISDALQKVNNLPNKPVVIRNIPKSFELKKAKYFHKKFNIDESVRIIIHSGNIYHSSKRIRMLIEAVVETDGVEMVFMCDKEKQTPVKRILAEMENVNGIYFHEFIKSDQLGTVISAADIGIVHTWRPEWEGHWLSLPNRIMEYTLAGLPLIATKQPEFLKLGEEFKHIEFYHGTDKKQLKLAIRKIVDHYPVYKEKAISASQNLSWEKESKKFVDLISNCIHE